MDINSVTLSGRITKDAELRVGQAGTSICRFSIAHNRREKHEGNWTDSSYFYDAVIFGKTADAISQYLVRGASVTVIGKLVYNQKEDKRYYQVIVDQISFSSKSEHPVKAEVSATVGQYKAPPKDVYHGESYDDDLGDAPF